MGITEINGIGITRGSLENPKGEEESWRDNIQSTVNVRPTKSSLSYAAVASRQPMAGYAPA